MYCTFSSIAWRADQASEVAAVLRASGASGIEASPALFSIPPDAVSPALAREVRAFWEGAGLPIVAMQSLLFGKPDLTLFDSQKQRSNLADYLRAIFRLASNLGAGPLIFGSPKNRLRKTFSCESAFSLAAEFFMELAPHAANEGVILCIEANAAAYGCDFITTHEEAALLVQEVGHKGFGMQVDTGVMQMNGEAPSSLGSLLLRLGIIPEHTHISEPFLATVTQPDTAFHQALSSELRNLNYSGVVSIEMKNPENNLITVLHDALHAVAPLYSEEA